MKKIYFILLALMPLFCVAQSNYKKGFIVSLKGDTTRGYIDYKEWSQTPKSIDFKTTLNANKQFLTNNDIESFGIDGFEYYKRYVVSVSQDGADLSNASLGIDTSTITSTVFLKSLQSGKNLSLFSYRDKIKTRYYILENSTAIPQELLYKVFLDNNSFFKRNIYQDQITLLANKYSANSPALLNQIKHSNYMADALITLVAQINGKDLKQINDAIKSLHNKGRFFIGAAFTNNKLKYGLDENPFPNAKPSQSNTPALTLGYDAFINPNVGRLLLRIELKLSSNTYNTINSDNNTYSLSPHHNSQTLKQNMAAFTPQVIYNIFNTDAFKFFLDAGVSLNIATYPKNVYTTDNIAELHQTNSKYPVINKQYFSLPLKAGIVLNKKIEIYGAYDHSMDMTDYLAISTKITTYQFGINYLFGK